MLNTQSAAPVSYRITTDLATPNISTSALRGEKEEKKRKRRAVFQSHIKFTRLSVQLIILYLVQVAYVGNKEVFKIQPSRINSLFVLI